MTKPFSKRSEYVLRDVHRIADSVASTGGLSDFRSWFRHQAETMYTRAERVALEGLTSWEWHPSSGNLVHSSGKFFSVEGLTVQIPDNPVPQWDQPIINQAEVGILGILATEFHGVLHVLMQAKAEPGNCNGVQLSPTVQATRSNYTGVHRGKVVPYLDYFRNTSRHRVIADVRQSEQGSWFHHKRNRNMVVEVVDEVPVLEGFCWLTLGQVHELLGDDDLINMDARTVLSCLPFAGADVTDVLDVPAGDDFRASLIRSCDSGRPSLHTTEEILSWVTELRTRTQIRTRSISLDHVRGWHRTPDKISHDDGLFFDVIGVHVNAGGREVGEWMQPMIEPRGTGIVAFLARNIDGMLHVLVNTRVEPGYLDVIELAPTVQCTPQNYEHLPAEARPRFLDEVLSADQNRVRFDVTLSEEGGRFYQARNRYLVIEAGWDTATEHPDFRWMTLHQLVDLLRHSHYLNIQARSLVACLHSLCRDRHGNRA